MDSQKIINSKILNNTPSNILKKQHNLNLKFKIIDFEVDIPSYLSLNNLTLSKNIKIREDILVDLQSIKNSLNVCGIPFVCDAYTPDINNTNLSIFGKIGLEISLNKNMALTLNSSDDDDYYIGPSTNQQLNIYGTVRKTEAFFGTPFAPEKKIYEIYDVRETYMKQKPKTKKIFKNMLNITNIFKKHGFLQKHPKKDFFYKSDVSSSFWNIFYKPVGLVSGTTQFEILETVYEKKTNGIWLEKEKIWDGENFNVKR